MNNVRTSLLEHDGGGWLRSLRFAVFSNALLGLAFPLAAALLGQALFPAQARGSLIERDGIVVGSSLVVYPAAYMPIYAKSAGARLVIINREPTPFDGNADRVIHHSAGEVLSRILERVRSAPASR